MATKHLGSPKEDHFSCWSFILSNCRSANRLNPWFLLAKKNGTSFLWCQLNLDNLIGFQRHFAAEISLYIYSSVWFLFIFTLVRVTSCICSIYFTRYSQSHLKSCSITVCVFHFWSFLNWGIGHRKSSVFHMFSVRFPMFSVCVPYMFLSFP